MKKASYLATTIVASLLLLAGCAGAPAGNDDAAGAAGAKGRSPDSGATPPAPQPKPAAPPAAQRPAPPDASAEGMTVYELQERLAKLGYKPGSVDGIPGPRTTDALKKYQADNKLPVTGVADAETIHRLRSDKP